MNWILVIKVIAAMFVLAAFYMVLSRVEKNSHIFHCEYYRESDYPVARGERCTFPECSTLDRCKARKESVEI